MLTDIHRKKCRVSFVLQRSCDYFFVSWLNSQREPRNVPATESITHRARVCPEVPEVYEENVHVPLIFINKRFQGEERASIGGLIDIAPTIMDLPGLPSAEKWQGRSLLNTNRTPRTYSFSPWSDSLFGYREGNRKYIFNATTGTHEIYDLLKDPEESTNLSMHLGQEVPSLQRRLAGWVQYQNEFIGFFIDVSAAPRTFGNLAAKLG
jgi:phosphoglycerol transferase MdoB-like AlkP superfamily enzyme